MQRISAPIGYTNGALQGQSTCAMDRPISNAEINEPQIERVLTVVRSFLTSAKPGSIKVEVYQPQPQVKT